MRSFLDKCRRVAGSTVICILIGLAGTSTANAQFFFGFGFGFLCGSPNTPPVPIHIAGSGGLRILVPTMNTTVLQESEDGLRKLKHQIILKMVHPNGNAVWSRTLSVKSRGIVEVFQISPGQSSFFFTDQFQLDRSVSPIFPFTFECMGLGVVESGGQRYVTVALGTEAATGNPTMGEDKSHINIWVLDRNTGAIVNVFRPRPKPNRYFLPSQSGIYDIDNDGNAEMVLIYGIFIGADRYDFVAEYYDLLTGALKNKIRTNQFNRLIIQ